MSAGKATTKSTKIVSAFRLAFTFSIVCSVIPSVVGIRKQRNVPHMQGSISHLRWQSLDDHSISESESTELPIPGPQVAAHVAHEELLNTTFNDTRFHQHALLDTTQAKHRGTPLPPMEAGRTNRTIARNNSPPLFSSMYADYPRNLSKFESARFEVAPPKDNKDVLMAIGGGTGARIGSTGSLRVDRDLLRRMHYQDKAAMLLVLIVYFVALSFSANLTYRYACNHFPVTYYADPRFHNLIMEGHDLDVFLENFNQPPKNISLQVAGYLPVPEEIHNSVRWRGENFQVAFTFSLDLSPWVVQEQTGSSSGQEALRRLHDGLIPEDRSRLHNYLTSDENDLAYVEISKKVTWPGWEELATNIKHQIRQSGFTGVISVDRSESDELQVYKNKPWANFCHARATRIICALSIAGWMIYVPYMWLRCKNVNIASYYRVDVNISDYWPLIADKLTADGFQENRPAPPTVSFQENRPAATTEVPAPA